MVRKQCTSAAQPAHRVHCLCPAFSVTAMFVSIVKPTIIQGKKMGSAFVDPVASGLAVAEPLTRSVSIR
jgi:hypothetical protein